MGKKIVITRANHQAQAFAAAIVNRLNGVSMNDFVFEPMSEIIHFPFDLEKFAEYDGIIMTSMNAAVSLGLNGPARELLADKPFYCVGAQEVAICEPTAEELSEAMQKAGIFRGYGGKRLLYMRGRNIAYDIKEALLANKGKDHPPGGSVDEVVCYEARAVERFSPNIQEMLEPGAVGLMTFFSARTAEVFVELWNEEIEKEEGYKEGIKGVKALCISRKVAEVLYDTFGKNACVVAKSPSMVGMIDKLEDGLI